MGLPVCSLVPLDRERIELVRSWRNLERIRANMFTCEPITAEGQVAWFAGLAGDASRRVYLFEQDGRAIGVLTYNGIGSACASIGYYLGEEQVWPGTGLLLEYAALEQAFVALGIDEVVAEVLEANRSPQRLHEQFRFLAEGRRAEPLLRGGEVIQVLTWRMARSRWAEQREAVLASLPRQVRAACALLRLDR
jgi:UDP-4-amino-4,6-dideoxy-N-acetyl-beta-L-altrosamine N-acetyltransferase